MTQESQADEAFTQANEKDERTVYEVGFHIVPTVSEADLAGAVENVRTIITSSGAEVIKEKAAEKITFAYRIERSISGKREKYTEGYFGWIRFAVEAGEMPAITQTLRNTHDVLRFIVVETTREDTPSPRRAVFESKTLEGKTIEKPMTEVEKPAEVSEEELNKSIDALVG